MSSCIECGSKQAYWNIKDKDGKSNDYCDDCFKKNDLADYKKEMDEYYRLKKEEDLYQREVQRANRKSAENNIDDNIFRGGFEEPYCCEACYNQAGGEIAARVMQGASGVCAFCQTSVSVSFGDPSVLFPYKNQLFFICSACIDKGKDYVKSLNQCCMCGNELEHKEEPSFVINFSKQSDAHDTDYVTMLLIKEKDNPQIPSEIREFLIGDRKGTLTFGVTNLSSGGASVTISLEGSN